MMTRRKLWLTSSPHAGQVLDRVAVEYAYYPDEQPPPWWSDIVCSPQPWGRPTGYTIAKEPLTMSGSQYGWWSLIKGSVTVELNNIPSPPSYVSMYPIYLWPIAAQEVDEPGTIYSVSYDYHGSDIRGSTTPQFPVAGWSEDPAFRVLWESDPQANLMLGGTRMFSVGAGDVTTPHYMISPPTVDECQDLHFPRLLPYGIQILIGNAREDQTTSERFGYTNVCAGTYYVGKQFRPEDHPTYGVAEPYL